MPEKVTAWKCSHCNMTSLSRASVARHEKKSCRKFRSCLLCARFIEEYEEFCDAYSGYERTMRVLYCYDEVTGDSKELGLIVCNCPDFTPKEAPDAD